MFVRIALLVQLPRIFSIRGPQTHTKPISSDPPDCNASLPQWGDHYNDTIPEEK